MVGESKGKASDGPKDLGTCADHSFEGAGDFGLSDTDAVADRDFEDAQTCEDSFDLHLDGPSVVSVPHIEDIESLASDGAKRSKIREGVSPTQGNEVGSEPISEAGLGGGVRLVRGFLVRVSRG